MSDCTATVGRPASSYAGVGVLLVGLSSLSLIVFPHTWLAGLPWLVGVGLAVCSRDLTATEKVWMIGAGVVPIVSAFTYPAGPATLFLIAPAAAALIVHARLSHRRSSEDHAVTQYGAHDRSEAQSIEIVLALFLGVTACVSVLTFFWLLRQLAGAADGPVWSVASTTLAISAGLGALLGRLLRAGRDGL